MTTTDTDTMTTTDTDTMTATTTATAARFEVVSIDATTGVETVTATRWTLAAAIAAANMAGAARRPNIEIRFCGVTLMHGTPAGLAPTAFRPAAL